MPSLTSLIVETDKSEDSKLDDEQFGSLLIDVLRFLASKPLTSLEMSEGNTEGDTKPVQIPKESIKFQPTMRNLRIKKNYAHDNDDLLSLVECGCATDWLNVESLHLESSKSKQWSLMSCCWDPSKLTSFPSVRSLHLYVNSLSLPNIKEQFSHLGIFHKYTVSISSSFKGFGPLPNTLKRFSVRCKFFSGDVSPDAFESLSRCPLLCEASIIFFPDRQSQSDSFLVALLQLDLPISLSIDARSVRSIDFSKWGEVMHPFKTLEVIGDVNNKMADLLSSKCCSQLKELRYDTNFPIELLELLGREDGEMIGKTIGSTLDRLDWADNVECLTSLLQQCHCLKTLSVIFFHPQTCESVANFIVETRSQLHHLHKLFLHGVPKSFDQSLLFDIVSPHCFIVIKTK
mgnify:CR=1 FL=1